MAAILSASSFCPGRVAQAPRAAKATVRFTTKAVAAPDFACTDKDEECIAGWFDDAKSKRPSDNHASRSTFFVGGNWKCNLDSAKIDGLVAALNETSVPDNVEAVVSPPAIYLQQVQQSISDVYQVSAQNCWTGAGGAFTGEISAEMLLDKDIPWVITGHSERRALLGETSEFVAKKTAYAVRAGMSVMACIGETLEEREAGRTLEVCKEQLAALAYDLEVFEWANVVIAYEPVWAIGTGKVATPEQAQETHAAIREYLAETVSSAVAERTRILYGGSVKSNNAETLAAMPDIDGFLVGGAALQGEEFAAICAAGAVKAATHELN